MLSNIRIEDNGAFDMLRNLGASMEEAGEEIVERASQITLNAMQREADATYARSIPTNGEIYAYNKKVRLGEKVNVKRKSIGTGPGKAAWERSGDLKSQLTIVRPSRFVAEIGPVGSSETYFDRLANLPTGALGINRSNNIFAKALRVITNQLPAVVQQGIANALNRLRRS